MKKRILRSLAFLVVSVWLGLAVLWWWMLGATSGWFLSGLWAGPALAWELVRPDHAFAGLEPAPAVAELRRAYGRGVTPSDGRRLHDMVVERGCKRVLDVGTARGYATLWMALAARQTGGRVLTIEINPAAAAEARENFRRAGLASAIDSRTNDALVEIPALQGEFDLVFLDVGVPLNTKLLESVSPRVAQGGVIVGHNAIWHKVAQPGFLEALNAGGYETTVVPTLSGGLSVSVKRGNAVGAAAP